MRRRLFAPIGLILFASLAASCDTSRTRVAGASTAADSARRDSISRARQDSINRAQPGYIVDSIFPPEEELRRFRQAVDGTPVTAFSGGSPSREALVRRFVAAVASADTNDLRAMVIKAREFADLYYPTSLVSKRPYYQSPSLAWRLIQDPSLDGLSRLLARKGGKPMRYVSHKCDPKIAHEGKNTRYVGCLVTVREGSGPPVTRLYFGSIIERDGQFKFLSYNNKL
jgi:hypothetical protein